MKKRFLLLLLFGAISSVTYAQQQTTAVYNKGDNLLNIGIGLGSPFFGSGYSSSLPVNPTISYEKGITDEISVGGQLSYASSKASFSYFGSGYSFKESALYIGARGSYHLNDALDIDDNRVDVYGGASLGYVIVHVSATEGPYSSSGSAGSAIGLGAFAGGKYFFNPKTGIYAELGYQSLSFLNIGVAFKL
ncbi:Outer membrane protein beta-barrel domain-containing protein [Mucilaginibacter pineti]|uniref:Outer membrane protein beta-barrel domain-containing protein n=1 Tax=Mucilaginibacter pineti TaxID=1391627 RepID=A0A1G6XKJ4_9SPHI|nr:outer membrane beta-barrel protein [Mucilaginibacter pineti]SDD78293.1 Outer membrane protein beta-barrel domain-containing protein [Mucilaginibacter pineti]